MKKFFIFIAYLIALSTLLFSHHAMEYIQLESYSLQEKMSLCFIFIMTIM